MDLNYILKAIESQKKDEKLNEKLFRFTGLVQAIEFFSQEINQDQIIDGAFDFVNELLTIERSAVFIEQGDNYILKKVKGFSEKISKIEKTEKHESLAIYHGFILYEVEEILKYFSMDIVDAFSVHMVIPLINETRLLGFILISNKTEGNFASDDLIISVALMRLINNSLDNYINYEKMVCKNKQLDEKIFNLFAINQSSKALLSELSLEVLFNLSVDVFSELTQSVTTGFVLYDNKSEKYELKAFRDVMNLSHSPELQLTQNKMAMVDINRMIIDCNNTKDVYYFNSIFKEGIESVIKNLKTKYIVLLIKSSKILGFVTLGEKVTGTGYKSSMFELIESMASSTYIALINAQLFKKVNEQKDLIQNKLDKLISLNNLMRNINSSVKIDVLMELTLKTLEVAFEVDKAIFATYNSEKNSFSISKTLNIETRKREIKTNAEWKKVFEGDVVFEPNEEAVKKYLSKPLLDDVEKYGGILLVPIYIDRIELEMLGCIIVLKYKDIKLDDEEHKLTLETIAGHIAPVVSNLHTIEEQNKFLLPNYIELFKKDLKQEIKDASGSETVFEVVQVVDKRDMIFHGNTHLGKLRAKFEKVYPFNSKDIFIINTDVKDIDKKIKKIVNTEETEIFVYNMGRDFTKYSDFFDLFK
jgi:transcriptional regulator with GAF, ATPase, and Fis domain